MMDRQDMIKLEAAYEVLARHRALRLASDLAEGLLALIDVADLVGLIDTDKLPADRIEAFHRD